MLGWLLGRCWISPRRVAQPPQAAVALVIDDCGYHHTTVPVLQSIDRPLTLSVLPQHAYSRAMAELGAAQHFEVMLHLPMEPREGHVPPRGWERMTLTTRMSHAEIHRQMDAALASVPYVRGVNNHMGSKATADAALMRTVLKELKARRLYFVDSLVTSHSVCKRIAHDVGIRFGQRAVFLDNDNHADAIRGQLMKLVAEAKRQGNAIGIGHDRPMTLSVIRQMIPEMEAQGVRLVRVSDVVREQE